MKKLHINKSRYALLGVLLLLVLFLFVPVYLASVVATTAVSVEQNGSRLVAKTNDGTPVSYQWKIADAVDGVYSDIVGATEKYYDIAKEDQGKYIRVVVDGVESEPTEAIGKLIIMDIAKGAINLGVTYSGKDSEGNDVSGTHETTNLYVIVQSDNATKTVNNISFSGNLPEKPFDVTLAGVNMGASPTNHSQQPGAGGTETPTGGQINIPATETEIKKVTLRLKGENVVRYIKYYNGGDTNVPANISSSLKITDINGDGATDGGSLFVPVKLSADEIDDFVKTNTNYNHWNAGIGGMDATSLVQNLFIAGGKIQVVTTLGDNCTAIGAGGNGYCHMEISGGEIIAHCNGTGAAIGGGIGWNAAGGKANVLISGGKVYAKNHAMIQSGDEIVGGVAIGSGSSFHKAGSDGKVTITGGTVEAYGTFGNGIGGGNSSTSTGGNATISITGGTVTATSIGGGNSKKGAGGDAVVTVEGDADVILDNGIGGGLSESGTGGAATITVKGGTMTAGGSIGGGEGGGTGNGGDAKVYIHGGNLTAASIGGGVGSAGGHGGAAEIYVYKGNGVIRTGSIGGGKTQNPAGQLGYAKAVIEGGDISGQFLMAAGGTEPCTFTMTGGTLHGVNTADTSTFTYAQQNGAAVYMDDPNGVVDISGGIIKECSAQNGGAIYMSDGTCTISGTASVENCNATENGGAIYMGGGNVNVVGGSVINNTATVSGGGIAVNNGNYRMTGGVVDNNSAKNGAGGGIYVSANGHDVTVDVLSGSVSKNTAKGNGGAFAVVGKNDGAEKITVTVGVNKPHFDGNGELITNCEHGNEGEKAYDCPVLIQNQSGASGGGIYVTGNISTVLNIFCLEESGSRAEGDKGQSDFMKVEGGKVTITTSDQQDENNQTSYYGNTHIRSGTYVTGGQMDIWGEMTNPRLEDIITVDITKEGDHFIDHRKTNGYYKLLYYENFTDPISGVITGQYKEIEVVQGLEETISGNIYSHPGYTIIGWNTADGYKEPIDNFKQKDYPNQDRGWYDVGLKYLFDGNPIGDLTIYAIWEANGYTVTYDPNVPAGETYTGSMDSVNFTYDVPNSLNENLFARPGYAFAGWSKDPNGPVEYGDKETVTNLTTEKGKVVTLYAQWTPCDHDPIEHVYIYSVVDNGKTLKRDCSCGKYSETITLSAENTVYDMDKHYANAYESSGWTVPIVYKQGDTVLDDAPVNAGTYTANITEGGCTARVTYTIAKAEQPAPQEKPKFYTEIEGDGSVLSIYPIVASPLKETDPNGYDAQPEYRIVYYDTNGTMHATDWKAADLSDSEYAVTYHLDVALTNYYIYARYGEGTNYNPSPEIAADSVYFFAGEVMVIVKCGAGVNYTILEADGTSDKVNGIDIRIWTLDGYFFPADYEVTIDTQNAENNGQATLTADTLYQYKIDNIPKKCTITITLPDAKKALSIDAKITEKQVFGQVTTDSATISRDSAYTVLFDVNNYHASEYESLDLTFSSRLPAGTTIIMLDKNKNEYYWVDASDVTGLSLTSFVRMGDKEKSSFGLRDGDFDLQFVVDFSQTSDGISGNQLTTSICARKKSASLAGDISCNANAELKDIGSFTLQIPDETMDEISYAYDASMGAASKWDNRHSALVITPKGLEPLPADAHLSLVNGNSTTVIYANSNGEFVYQMPADAGNTIKISLISKLLSAELTEYEFDARWIVANSKAEMSHANGELVAKTEFKLAAANTAAVSLKIYGDKKLYAVNEVVHVQVEWKDLPLNHQMEVVLMVKSENGEYSSTAVTQKIDFNTIEGTKSLQISLAGNNAGSYRLHLTAEYGLVMVAHAEYYFLVE